jgi:predicted helicase
MACAGKTLVCRWLTERRIARTTLVLVPSLALIAQTLTEWRSAGGGWLFEALIICSDPT